MDETRTIVGGDVWRRVPVNMFAVEEDRLRVQPGALNDHPEDGYLSVGISAELNPDEFVRPMPGCAVLVLAVSFLVEKGLTVRRVDWHGEPGHAGVYGYKSKGLKREIIRSATSLTHPALRCVDW
jgi:hypothetical protein